MNLAAAFTANPMLRWCQCHGCGLWVTQKQMRKFWQMIFLNPRADLQRFAQGETR